MPLKPEQLSGIRDALSVFLEGLGLAPDEASRTTPLLERYYASVTPAQFRALTGKPQKEFFKTLARDPARWTSVNRGQTLFRGLLPVVGEQDLSALEAAGVNTGPLRAEFTPSRVRPRVQKLRTTKGASRLVADTPVGATARIVGDVDAPAPAPTVTETVRRGADELRDRITGTRGLKTKDRAAALLERGLSPTASKDPARLAKIIQAQTGVRPAAAQAFVDEVLKTPGAAGQLARNPSQSAALLGLPGIKETLIGSSGPKSSTPLAQAARASQGPMRTAGRLASRAGLGGAVLFPLLFKAGDIYAGSGMSSGYNEQLKEAREGRNVRAMDLVNQAEEQADAERWLSRSNPEDVAMASSMLTQGSRPRLTANEMHLGADPTTSSPAGAQEAAQELARVLAGAQPF